MLVKFRFSNISFIAAAVLLIIYTSQLLAIVPLKPLKTDVAPKIDGELSDEIWQKSHFVTDFKKFIPDFGKDASQKTIVYFAYDEENLYFAFRCFETESDKIKTSSRDNMIQNDWVCINLDTFNDQQALTAFYINPMGIQADNYKKTLMLPFCKRG